MIVLYSAKVCDNVVGSFLASGSEFKYCNSDCVFAWCTEISAHIWNMSTLFFMSYMSVTSTHTHTHSGHWTYIPDAELLHTWEFCLHMGICVSAHGVYSSSRVVKTTQKRVKSNKMSVTYVYKRHPRDPWGPHRGSQHRCIVYAFFSQFILAVVLVRIQRAPQSIFLWHLLIFEKKVRIHQQQCVIIYTKYNDVESEVSNKTTAHKCEIRTNKITY